jgi:ABC-type uncharacterized transport system auxiliary subunit
MIGARSLFAAACLALAGCALLGKDTPVVPRYFSLQAVDFAKPAAPPATNLRLRLGRIEGLSHLREPMVVRTSPQELTFLEEQRWTERPEVYLREGLAYALFDERGLVPVVSGRALTLDVELLAFEEIDRPALPGDAPSAGEHVVWMQVMYTLRDDRLGLLHGTQSFERAARPREVIDAYNQVLHEGVEWLAAKVVSKLGAAEAGAPAE